MSSLKEKVKEEIKSNQVLVFGKQSCPLTQRVKKLFDIQQVAFKNIDLDVIDNGEAIKGVLQMETKQLTVPYVYVNGAYCGGLDTLLATFTKGLLSDMIIDATLAADMYTKRHTYDYDLVVIGGGSGGLACAKAAAAYPGVKVACLDYVRPSPAGTKWGLGGTCVNVGCIPKKLMHQAALLGKGLKDARKFGWKFDEQVSHSWVDMVADIQGHIKSLNFKYRTDLRSKGVKYINALGELTNQHTVKHYKLGGEESYITASRIVIATGGRPRYPNIPGAREYGITSDDIFSLTTPPGKTVVIGASYVALECAGFLAEFGFPTYCMVRSILLRGFDQQMAEKIGSHMTKNKINFLHSCVPLAVELVSEGTPRVLRVRYKNLVTSKEGSFECNTVLFAVGRDPDTGNLSLAKAGVITDESGYIPTVHEQTNVPNIYAIGDIQKGKLQLTPLAIKAGRLLADRLFGDSKTCCNYFDVATTVFTPLEYGCIGLAEEDAEMIFGKDRIEVYHGSFTPLEYTVAQRDSDDCYMKLICDKMNKEKVIGLHVTGPNAGEITQGYALGMRVGVRKSDFDVTIGIHPTCSETFTTLNVTKSSGTELGTDNC